jgi:hypothetical protein
MYLANSLFSQGLNSVIDVFKQEAAKQKEDNTYTAIANLKQAAQDGINRNEQVQAAYSDPDIPTFDANDAANLRASQASTAPAQLSEMLNQYTTNKDATPIDLKLLNQQYDTIANGMQSRFDHREDLGMKLHDAATKEDQWRQDYMAGRQDALARQNLEEQRLKNEQELKRIQAAQLAQSMQYGAENQAYLRKQRTVAEASDNLNSSIGAYKDSLYQPLSIPITGDKTATLDADAQRVLSANPEKIHDYATQLGVTSAQLKSMLDSAEVARNKQVDEFANYVITHSGYGDDVARDLSSKLSPMLLKAQKAAVPLDSVVAANLNKDQLSNGFNSIVSSAKNVFKDDSPNALTYTRDKDGNYGFTVDPDAFRQITGMSVDAPGAAEKVKALAEYANKLGANSNFTNLLQNTNVPNIPSIIAQQNLVRQTDLANAIKEQNAVKDAANRDRTIRALSPDEIATNMNDNISKNYGTHIEASNAGKIATLALQNIAADTNLPQNLVTSKVVEDFIQNMARAGVMEDRSGKIFSLDRNHRDVLGALADTLAKDGKIDKTTADKLKSEVGSNDIFTRPTTDLDHIDVAAHENVADAIKKFQTILEEYQTGKRTPYDSSNKMNYHVIQSPMPSR